MSDSNGIDWAEGQARALALAQAREAEARALEEAEVKHRDQEIIDRITRIRMMNNIQWMRLLEIALEHAPEETKRVLKNINDNDRAVSDLLKDLAGW